MGGYKYLMLLLYTAFSCSSKEVQEYHNWQNPLVEKFGIYHFESFDLLVQNVDDIVKLELTNNDSKCLVIDKRASVFHRFFFFLDKDFFWFYSGDIGLFKIERTTNCSGEITKISILDTDNIPNYIQKIIDS